MPVLAFCFKKRKGILCNLPNIWFFFQGQSQQICAHILLDFQMALYILYGIRFHAHTHTNPRCSYLGLETFGTLSKNICAVYCGQTWVISACVSSWKIKKCKPELKLSAEFISSGTDLWQMQSRGLFFPLQSRQKAITAEGKLCSKIPAMLFDQYDTQSKVRLCYKNGGL